MAPIKAPFLFTETRLDLDEASPGSTLELALSSSNASTPSPKSPNHRVVSLQSLVQDEASFTKQRIATESSIYFRRVQRAPRAFLWRILDERRVLELQAVDLSQDRDVQGDAILTLQLRLPHAIRPYGVAFADPEDQDALCVLVLTAKNDLYTITLKRDMFIKANAAETSARGWYKMYQPSAFSIHTPYRLFAASALELLVSMSNGCVLRLARKPGDDGSHWRDTHFTPNKGYLSFRGLLPFKGSHSIRFGEVDLDSNTTFQIALSPDENHLFAAGLDHTLRAWNVSTGKIGVELDLLGDHGQQDKKAQKYLLSPTQAQAFQLIEAPENSDGINYHVVSYSPKGQQFKVWAILDADSGMLGVHDKREDVRFSPPLDDLMDTTMWTMEEFYLNPRHRWREAELWMRVRSGSSSRVFMLRFDILANQTDLQQIWQNNWVSVDGGSSTIGRLSELVPTAPDGYNPSAMPLPSVTEQWIEFLFHPGRFSKEILGTALYTFSNKTRTCSTRTSLLETQAKTTRPLKQQLVDAIVSAATMHVTQHRTEEDRQQPETQLFKQWRLFYGLVKDLQKRRAAVLAFTMDGAEGLPWLVSADYVSAIRQCSKVEIFRLNSYSPSHVKMLSASHPVLCAFNEQLDVQVAVLLAAVHGLSASVHGPSRWALHGAVAIEVFGEPSETIQDRIRAFDARSNIRNGISDDDFNQMLEKIKEIGGLSELDSTLFLAAADKIVEHTKTSGGRLDICRFGARELIRGAQETIRIASETFLDLLCLVIILAMDFDETDMDLSPQFDPNDLFAEFISQLRDHALLEWMMTTMRLNHTIRPSHRGGSSIRDNRLSLSSSISPPAIKSVSDIEAATAQTVMESIFIGDWANMTTTDGRQLSESLTLWGRAWVYGLDPGNNYDELAADILSHLIKYGDVQIASEFERFVPKTPWAEYLKGRLAIVKGDFDTAAMLFKRSSFGLGLSHFDVNDSDRAQLLDEDERNYFDSGLVLYYQHISSLFDCAKAHSHVIGAANLALQSMRVCEEAREQTIEDDILSRLFSACIATARYEEAYSALGQYRNPKMRKASLSTLLTALLSLDPPIAKALFARMPFTTTAVDADAILASQAANSLSVVSGPGARLYKTLYAFRVRRSDYRGAAETLWLRLQRLRAGGEKVHDPESREAGEVRRCWLGMCNALSCVGAAQAWIFADDGGDGGGGVRLSFGRVGEKRKRERERRIVTLGDCRRGYQEELDRVEAVRNGRFAFGGGSLTSGGAGGGGDVMDVL